MAPRPSALGRIVRGVGRAALAALLVSGLWRFLHLVLAADRGLDLTDEGLYLLAAQPPSLEAAWGTPAGWHTAPLFRAVAYDVAAFRTLGAVLLVLSAGVLGHLAVAVGQYARATEPERWDRAERAAGVLLGGLSGLLYYGGLLRTPSYNWVTVFGATVAAVGLLAIVASRLASLSSGRESTPRSLLARPLMELSGIALAGFGAFFTVPAKPTTPIFFALLAVPVLRLAGDFRFVVRSLVSITGAALAFLAVAVISGVWPVGFVRVFFAAVSGPSLLPEQNLAGALLTIPTFPFDLLRDPRLAIAAVSFVTFVALHIVGTGSDRAWSRHLRSRTSGGVALLVLAAFGTAYVIAPRLIAAVHALPSEGWSGFVMGNRDVYPVDSYVGAVQRFMMRLSPLLAGPALGVLLLSAGRRARPLLLLLGVLALSEVNQHLLSVLGGNDARMQFGQPELTRGTVLAALWIALTAAGQFTSSENVEKRGSVGLGMRASVAAASLWLVGVSTGFGSGNGLVRQSALAAGILVSALLLGGAAVRSPRDCFFALVVVTFIVVPLAALYFVSNFQAPYRSDPISAQLVETPVGVDGATLRLDEDLAALLAGITEAAGMAGWEPGMPMLALASPWSSTLPWHLGALVPDSLMLTIGGYGAGSEDRLHFSLEQYVDDRFTTAWILVNGEDDARRDESILWAETAAFGVGRAFPNDYQLVFSARVSDSRWVREFGNVELWSPMLP